MESVSLQKEQNYTLMTLILSWTGMVVMSSLYVSIPLISLFSSTLHISLSKAAITSSIFSVGFAVGCFFYGAISEKYGRKNVIVVGLLILSFISLLLGTVNSFPLLVGLRGLQGLAAATFSPVALAYTLEVFPNDRKVGAVGFISTGFLVAGIVGQLFSSTISQSFNWHLVFYLLAIVYILTAFILFYLLPAGVAHNRGKNIFEPLKHIGAIFKNKNIVLSYVIAFVLLMSFVSMYTTLGQYLAEISTGNSNQQLFYIRAIGILGMVLSPLSGALAKRFSILPVIRFALSLAVVSLVLMGLTANIILLTIVSVLFVSGIALAVPSIISLVGQLGGKFSGIAVSMYTVILFAGTSLGPVISVAFIHTGSYTAAFALLAATLSAGLIAACLIRKKDA